VSRIRYDRLPTERPNPRTRDLDRLSPREVARLMHRADEEAIRAVGRVAPSIGRAVELIVDSLSHGGRLVFVGAGTSGRLGVLDASEAPPTFGVDPDLVVGIIAGGDAALRHSIEGAEDDSGAGARAARDHVREGDVLVGISASGRAKYVTAAMVMAREVGARTVALTCDASSPLAKDADIAIVVDVGPEVLAGSSRLKAGTATKLVLNMLSTAAMIRSGRTRGDLMVDLRPTNAKLRARAIRMVQDETGLGEDEARARLEAAGWSVRKALGD
jgi:N-acetylmuramic acid 6-phosphate etherase